MIATQENFSRKVIDFLKYTLFISHQRCYRRRPEEKKAGPPRVSRNRNAAGSCRLEPKHMTVKHIIFDASVLAKFPQAENFFKAARDSYMGVATYIRSHCVLRTDIWHILNLLQRKNIDVIVLSNTPYGAGQVLDAFGIPYSRSINTLDEIEDEASDYGYVTTLSRNREKAKARGFRAVRFVPGIGQDTCEVLSLAGYRNKSNL